MIGAGAAAADAGAGASDDVTVVEVVDAAVGSAFVVLEDLDFAFVEGGVNVYFVDMRV